MIHLCQMTLAVGRDFRSWIFLERILQHEGNRTLILGYPLIPERQGVSRWWDAKTGGKRLAAHISGLDLVFKG